MDWIPAPHERCLHADGLVVQLRDGVERIAWQGRSYHRTEGQGLRRREHRVVRVVGTGAARRYVASIEALGTVVEDHIVLDARGALLERRAPVPDERSGAPGGRGVARGARRPPAARGDPAARGARSRPYGRRSSSCGGRFPATSSRPGGSELRLSPKLARVYRAARAAAPGGTRRAVAQRLVREVLGLIGPSVREAAVAWLLALDPARQEAELAAAARRDRVELARAALAPLGRLLDALEAGGALPE